MKAVLLDLHWKNLLPLTFAKPLSHLLVGIDTIAMKWERHLSEKPGICTVEYLNDGFDIKWEENQFIINSAFIPSKEMVTEIKKLKPKEVLTYRGIFLAALSKPDFLTSLPQRLSENKTLSPRIFGEKEITFDFECDFIDKPSDIFSLNDVILHQDFIDITKGFKTTEFPKGVNVIGDDIFIHPSAKVSQAILNTETGPIYIGANAEIMEGSIIRGPFSLGQNATVKMGAKIYGATSIGKHCKVGGEISNSIINDYSNKGHDGFLGNSVIGSWCNLGADTNTSNLKNNYSLIKVWDYKTETFEQTNLQFHGLVMGDHSKSSINSMFNTGTVVGMCSNIFGGGFPPKFVPSFSWGGADNTDTFEMSKAFDVASAMMSRRSIDFTERDKKIFQVVSDSEQKFR